MDDSEFDWIKAIAGGNHQAFERLIKRYQNPLFNFIFRYLRDRCAAEDITQEVFLRVYQAAPRFDPKARVSSWIFKIAYNLSMNELERRKRFTDLLKNVHCMEKQRGEEDSTDPMPRHEMEEELSDALDGLPENQRAALLLRVHEGLSYREIAEVLDVSVQSVESLLFRARKHLRQAFGREPKEQKGVGSEMS